MEADTNVYFEQFLFEISQEVNVKIFLKSWEEVIAKNSILRTVFDWEDGEPIQIVLKKNNLLFNYIDLSQKKRVYEIIRKDNENDLKIGFNLKIGPLIRITLFKLNNKKYISRLSYHHIILDGASIPLLFDDFMNCYDSMISGKKIQVIARRPYKAYIQWLLNKNITSHETFWRKYLSGYKEMALIPVNSTKSNSNAEVKKEKLIFPQETTRKLQFLAEKYHLTMNNLLQGIWSIIISEYSAKKDILFGSTILGRSIDLDQSNNMIGLFVNTLPVRVIISETTTFIDLARKIQTDWIETQPYESSPLGEIKKQLEFKTNGDPFQTIFVFGGKDLSSVLENNHHKFKLKVFDYRELTNYDITVDVNYSEDLIFQVSYLSNKICAIKIAEIVNRYITLIDVVYNDPNKAINLYLNNSEKISYTPAINSNIKNTRLNQINLRRLTDIENELLEIWKNILPNKNFSISDSFFEIGGDSIFCIRLVSQLIKKGYNISIKQIFEYPTIIQQAMFILSLENTSQLVIDASRKRAIKNSTNENIEDVAPVTFIRESILLECRGNNDLAYHEQATFEYEGIINYPYFEQAWNKVIDSNQSLRTIYQYREGKFKQMVINSLPVKLQTINLSHQISVKQKMTIKECMEKDLHAPFILDRGPLIRIYLFKLAENRHLFYLSFNVVVLDGWCFAFIMKDFYDFYRALYKGEILPTIKREPYLEYVRWLYNQNHKRAFLHWKRYLSNYEPKLYIKRDKSKIKSFNCHTSSNEIIISNEILQKLINVSRNNGITLNHLLQAAWAKLLMEISGIQDVVIGTTVSGRPPEVNGSGEMVGLFFNDLPMRFNFSKGKNIFELAKNSQAEFAANLDFDYISNKQIIELLNLPKNSELFQTIFVFENYPKHEENLLKSKNKEYMLETKNWRRELSSTDLTVYCEVNHNLTIEIKYINDVFEQKTIENIILSYEKLIDNIAGNTIQN